jgi:hypothetical protein
MAQITWAGVDVKYLLASAAMEMVMVLVSV